jgi:hypothetical protein
VELVLSDGTSVPVEPGAATLAFSDQLMEELHPDDARAQLAKVAAALPAAGTPASRPTHSRAHTTSPGSSASDGFPLREYTIASSPGCCGPRLLARARLLSPSAAGRSCIALPLALERALSEDDVATKEFSNTYAYGLEARHFVSVTKIGLMAIAQRV